MPRPWSALNIDCCFFIAKSGIEAGISSGAVLEYDIKKRYLSFVNSKHRATLQALFERPTRADIRWADIESLIGACGGEIHEREGSRVAFILNGVRSVFHRPHPKPFAKTGAIDAVRLFLRNAGVRP